MHTALALSALVALSSALPVMDPVDETKNISWNDPCAPQPVGYGPVALNDTVEDFYASPEISTVVAGAATLANYTQVFSGLMNATTLTHDYLGYKTMSSYNVTECAMICDAMEDCVAFNTFFERNPTLNPNATEGCPNPASTTNIKCAWWSTPINETSATNSGEHRVDFQVVIAGSNGYVSNANVVVNPSGPSNIPNYEPGEKLAGIAQGPDGEATYFSSSYYPLGTQPSYCASECTRITNANYMTAVANEVRNYQPCNYFNSYTYTTSDGTPKGLACNYYEYVQHPVDANGQNPPAYTMDPNPKVKDSYGWALAIQDPGLTGS